MSDSDAVNDAIEYEELRNDQFWLHQQKRCDDGCTYCFLEATTEQRRQP